MWFVCKTAFIGPLYFGGAGQSGIAEANAVFSPAFDEAYTLHLQRKLGLEGMELGDEWVAALRHPSEERSGTLAIPSDREFVMDLMRLMADCGTDFTDTWRAFIEVPPMSVALRRKVSSGSRPRSAEEMQPESNAMPMSREREGLGDPDFGYRDGSNWEERTKTRVNIDVTDDECLRPLSAVLTAAGTSGDRKKQWARWIRRYMARIDTQASRCYNFSRKIASPRQGIAKVSCQGI